MNNHITFSQVCRMLDAQKMAYEVLTLGNGWKAIITQYSGRLLGPFKGENGESVLWVNAALNDEAAFRDFVRERRLHLGGERLWVNPELKFYCQAPELFDATYTVQPEIDPGNYALERQGGQCIPAAGNDAQGPERRWRKALFHLPQVFRRA